MKKVNGIYKHYKWDYYIEIDIVKNSETLEEYAIYRQLEGKLWISPIKMFLSKMDSPQSNQQYRWNCKI